MKSTSLLILLFATLAGGCMPEQHSEFRGTLARGAAAPAIAPEVHRISGQFGTRREELPDALTGFSLGDSEGSILFIHDRRAYESGSRLSNKSVSAIYLADWTHGTPEQWEGFINLDEAARDRLEGVHRLHGSFNVTRWKSNVDFHISLSMQSAAPQSVTVDGSLTIHEHQRFRPLEWLGWALMGPFLK